jgi:hypothetical protein
MKVKRSAITIGPRDSLLSRNISPIHQSTFLDRKTLPDKVPLLMPQSSSHLLIPRRQTISLTKENKAIPLHKHVLDKGYRHSLMNGRKTSAGKITRLSSNQTPGKITNPNRTTHFFKNRKHLASMIDGFRKARASNISENNFTVHAIENKSASTELLQESNLLLCKQSTQLQIPGTTTANFPRRKNIIKLPAFGATYSLSSKQKNNSNTPLQESSSNTFLGNSNNESLAKFQMMKDNYRSKSRIEVFKKAKSQGQLDELLRNTLVVDPEKIRSKAILKEPLSKISSDIDERITQNFSKMKDLGRDISLNLKQEMDSIVRPLKEEIRRKRQKLLRKIIEFLSFVNELNIPPEMILEFPTRSYQHPKSVAFIEYAKMGRNERLVDLLFRHSKLLVYEYDNFRLTALHWAAIRNHSPTMDILIEWGSYINATDVYERTPLYYAIRSQNVYMVFELLMRRASPWSPKGDNYIELAGKHQKIIYFIKKFRMMDLMMKFQNPSKREEFRSYYLRTKISRP